MRQKKCIFGRFSPLWCWVWRFCLFVRGLVGPVHCLNNQRGISSHTHKHLYKGYKDKTPKPIPDFFPVFRFCGFVVVADVSPLVLGLGAFSAIWRVFRSNAPLLPFLGVTMAANVGTIACFFVVAPCR